MEWEKDPDSAPAEGEAFPEQIEASSSHLCADPVSDKVVRGLLNVIAENKYLLRWGPGKTVWKQGWIWLLCEKQVGSQRSSRMSASWGSGY